MKAEPLSRKQIAWRAAQDIPDGAYVNLGIGLPTLAANHLPEGREVIYHSENGLLGLGPAPTPDKEEHNIYDAGSASVTLMKGAAVFDSVEAFAMMRGGHLDLTLLGAFQVAANGDLANWDSMQPHRGPLVGGAMDLVYGAKRVRVIMEHVTRKGEARLVHRCSYPLTAPGVVSRIYTDLAVVDVDETGFVIREARPGWSQPDLEAVTEGPVRLAPDLVELTAPDI